jgi:protein O-GlcNAc transferase
MRILQRVDGSSLFLYAESATTASDALWAGLPVLTCAGEAFSSRMAASLLIAMDLPELVTATPMQYEEAAVSLARDESVFAQLKRKVAEGPNTSPLFDPRQFTRHLEAGFTAIYERHQSGQPPDHVVVPPSGSR